MPVFVVKANTAEVFKALDQLKTEQIPFATALALTRTAQAARAKLIEELPADFDKPTPFTLNAFYLRTATKTDLRASVEIKDRQTRYLTPEIEGGERRGKGFEGLLARSGILQAGWYAVPTSAAPLDQYGNVPGSTLNKILSQLQSARDSQANESAAAKTKRNKKLPQGRYFAVKVGDTSHLKPGIYERLGSTYQSKVRPIFTFTPQRPKYSKRFDFYGAAQRYADDAYPEQFRLAIERAIATQR